MSRGKPENLTNAGKGRVKGVPNKTTQLAKEAIAQVAEGLGGVQRMIAWAKEDEANERVFWASIYTKLIPVQTEISGKDGGAIEIEQKIKEDAHVVTSTVASLAARMREGSLAGPTQH